MSAPTKPRIIRIAVFALLLLLIGLVAYGITAARTRIVATAVTPPPVTAPPTPTEPLTDIARDAIGRVITVEALRSGSESLGTGWLFDSRGDFVTNAHVIAGQLGVRLRDRDGHTHFATIVGVDNDQDIAMVRSTDGFAGTPLRVNATASLTVPQGVVLVASGEATGKPDVTTESLSQTGLDVPVQGNPDLDPGVPQTTKVYHDMLQLEGARVYQGNSGGPVLDGGGDVVGILTLASRAGDQAYAIPIARVLAEIRGWAAAS